MRLINQKGIRTPRKIKKPSEIDLGIKEIIVIPHDAVTPEGSVQLKFEGAYPVVPGTGFDGFTGVKIASVQKIIKRLVDSAEVPFGKGAAIRIAFPAAAALGSP